MNYQIGDLIRYNSSIERISAVHKDYVLLESKSDDFKVLVNELEPIAIGEIYFLKQDFEKCLDTYLWEINGRRIRIQDSGFFGYSGEVENLFLELKVRFNSIKWLHQLQQAIRLCEINKELQYDNI